MPREVSYAAKKDAPLENTLEGWQVLAKRIGELTPDQQMQLALNLIKEQQKIEREKAIGGLVGTVEGTQAIVGDICDFFQFAGDCLVNQKRAQESIQKTAESLIQAGVAGVQLLEVAAVYGVVYADEVIESGDPAKPLKDAYLFGQQLEKSWAGLSDFERSRRLSRFTTEALGMMIPGPQVINLAKAGTVAKIVRVVTEDLAEVGGDVKKATQALVNFINELRPPGLIPQTVNGAPLENPGFFDHIKDASKKLKEKLDELHLKMSPERGEKPPKAKSGEYVDKGPPDGYKYDKPVAIEMARLHEHPHVKKLLASYAKTGKIDDMEGQRVADTIAESLRPFCKKIDKANIAFGVITKDGKQTLVVATSNHSDLPGCLPVPKKPLFTTVSEGYKYPTDHSEFRILDEFQRILKEDPTAKLAIFTEEDCCRSCGPAVDQFNSVATKLLGKPYKLPVTYRFDDKATRQSWNKRRTDWQ